MLKLTLAFSRVDCRRCGAARQTRFPCPDCGEAAAPTEIDVNVQARQRAVRDADDARSETVPAPDWDAMALLESGKLAEIPDRAFDAASKVAAGDAQGAEELCSLAREIAALERWVKDVAPLRPVVTLTDHVRTAARAMVALYDVLTRALTEERIEEAQRANDEIQAELDAAADAAAYTKEVLQHLTRVLDAEDPVAHWYAEAFGSDLVAATAQGQALFETRTGRTCEQGTALAALLYETALSTIGDPDMFWQLATAHLSVLEGFGNDLDTAVSEPLFTTRVTDVADDLWAAARRAAVTPDPETLRQAANDLLEAGHLLVEQPLKFDLGVACASSTRMTFADTQASDVSRLINIAKDRGWEVRSGVGDAVVRNAFAHRDFEVAGDAVSLSPQRRRQAGDPEIRMPLVVIEDQVLRMVETVAAMELALIAAMEDRGLALPSPSRSLVAPFLAGLGWTGVTLEDEGERVTISAEVHEEVPLNRIAFAAQPIAGSARRLVLQLTRDGVGEQITVEVPLEFYASWAGSEEEITKEVAFVRFTRETLIDGRPLMDDAHVTKYLTFRGCQTLVDQELPFPEINRRVKLFRHLARELDLTDVNRQLGKGLRLRSMAESGMTFDPAEFDELLQLAGAHLPPLQTMLI